MRNAISLKLWHICLLCLWLSLLSASLQAQNYFRDEDKLDAARDALGPAAQKFFNECMVEDDYRECLMDLVEAAENDPYQQHMAGMMLFSVDAATSLKLHKSALEAVPGELSMILEYGISLHRAGKWAEAVPHYLTFLEHGDPDDYRIHVWLSECYLNLNKIPEALAEWKLARFEAHRTAVDRAIYEVHEKSDQFARRLELQARVDQKDEQAAYELIYMDQNWQMDWWNSGPITPFFEMDMARILLNWGMDGEVVHNIDRYLRLLKGMSEGYKTDKDTMRALFTREKLILNGAPFFPQGDINSDLLNPLLMYGLVDASDMLEVRGEELLSLARKYKDPEFLNVVIFLEIVAEEKMSEDKLLIGWDEFHDERFAHSWLSENLDKLEPESSRMQQALREFPESSRIRGLYYKLLTAHDAASLEELTELIKLEFRTLGNDPSHYAYALNGYFAELAKY